MRIRNIFSDQWWWIVILMALFLVTASLLYSNFLVSRLAIEEERRVELLAKAQEFVGTVQDESCELNFILENILKGNESVPVIFADTEGNILEHRNIVDSAATEESKQNQLMSAFDRMKASDIPPVPIYLGTQDQPDALVLYIYYSESWLLRQLRLYPYIQLFVIGIFILFVFAGYAIAQRSKQNKLWVGMARETAHQLGTPISGMIAWIELLKEEESPEVRNEYLNELGKDVVRLENIAERFSKIGSAPDLHMHSPAILLNKSVDYIRRRMPGKAQVFFDNQLNESIMIPLDVHLFDWVVENLMKNALDALPAEDGTLHIRAFKGKKGDVIIEVEDNGKGISPQNMNRIFDTGFTTKKRGWGLGLSLSRRIIEKFFGGRIYVYKSEPGKGTTFRIILNIKSK
jgi:two-component sensor histidine kinase